jgi:hypothetical protein
MGSATRKSDSKSKFVTSSTYYSSDGRIKPTFEFAKYFETAPRIQKTIATIVISKSYGRVIANQY